jgi:pseudo-response regulator 5
VFYAALANKKTKKSTSQKKVLKNTETLEAGRDCNVMGEVVISSGEELEVRSKSEREEEKQRKQSKEETGEVKKKKKKKKEGEGLNDGFLPRMVLRVLLVEADDSTRQIIAALLRKCSYRGKLLDLVSQTGSIVVFLLIL